MKTLRDAVKVVANAGRGQDTMLAHINPREARVLRSLGGSGVINPRTGILEFDDGGGDGGGDGDGGGGWGGGASNLDRTISGLQGTGGWAGTPGGYASTYGAGYFGGVESAPSSPAADPGGTDPGAGTPGSPGPQGAGYTGGWSGYGAGAPGLGDNPDLASALGAITSGQWGGYQAGLTGSAVDPGLAAAVTAQLGSNPYASGALDIANEARNFGLLNRAEAQGTLANLSPTMRQRAQAAIFGGNLSPSLDALAGIIGEGAMRSDIVRGFNTGNLTSNEQGEVVRDTVGTISSLASPLTSVFSPVKMGLAAIMGAPVQAGIGLPGPLGLLSSAYKTAQSYGDLMAANRAMGGIPGAEPGAEQAASLASLGTSGNTAQPTASGTGMPTTMPTSGGPMNTLASIATGSPYSGGTYGAGAGFSPWGGYAPRLYG